MTAPSIRAYDLDFLRVLAIAAVVIIHCEMPIIIMLTPASTTWIIADIIDSYLRWCVPVFIMLSGALLIRPETFRHIASFYKRRMSRILVPLLAWPVLYVLWAILFRGVPVHPAEFTHGLLIGDPVAGYQLYFLFIIAGLYVIAPLLSAYAHSVSRRVFGASTALAFFIATAWLTLVYILPDRDEAYTMFTAWLPYVGYFMLGYYMRDVRPSRRHISLALFGFVLLGAWNALATVVTRFEGNMFFQSYISPTVILLSICAFVVGRDLYSRLERMTGGKLRQSFRQVVASLAGLSFGVYLIHVMILETIVHSIGLDKARLDTAATLMLLVPPLSLLIVILLSPIPYVRRLFG